MVSEQQIKELTYSYVFAISDQKYNPQMIANMNLFKKLGKDKIIEILSFPIEKFCNKYDPHKVRDFVYKNDYFTPRNVFLINPIYYIYYTYLVFKIIYKDLGKSGEINFSDGNMKVFYSGLLDIRFSQPDIIKKGKYKNSYKLFQKEREKYLGKSVLTVDVQDFFNSISISNLTKKLKSIIGQKKIVEDLEYFFKYCDLESLPQFHSSIASSILSQIYLTNFDAKVKELLVREKLQLIRYVDDMYIIHDGKNIDRKKNNSILNELSYYLWKDKLVLNTSKTKMLSPDEYKHITELKETNYEDSIKFSSEKLIEDKALDVIESGTLNILIDELCEIEKNDGIDLEKYKLLSNKYLSIENDNVSKVIKNIIYSKKWINLDVESLKKIILNWEYILFNPSEFTVLYILVYKYLEENKLIIDERSKMKQILNYLFKNDVFTLRDTLVAVSYLFQNKIMHQDLLKKISLVNPDYIKYLETFVK
ncbi:reverse transcriptase domain-containing protein [Exiguobacterium sp. 17-1]|uniref:reverse transcriptase domain-containing protein n=1 Tax=Exiguobacterium sp. 17-1 TaxID=2931981 RepID=UPI001FFEC2CD|nr:reverse transcriptase domain-containing protein [Exiguobacterium sp. 17-1]MCK2158699.1 reverse transcriptase domain-containing protein [Exiguobacterium sp. 17-1]